MIVMQLGFPEGGIVAEGPWGVVNGSEGLQLRDHSPEHWWRFNTTPFDDELAKAWGGKRPILPEVG